MPGESGLRARELLGELKVRAEREYVSPFWLAVGHASLGPSDRALAHLSTAVRHRDPNLLFLSATPRKIGWQDDPRYAAVMREVGLGHLIDRA